MTLAQQGARAPDVSYVIDVIDVVDLIGSDFALGPGSMRATVMNFWEVWVQNLLALWNCVNNWVALRPQLTARDPDLAESLSRLDRFLTDDTRITTVTRVLDVAVAQGTESLTSALASGERQGACTHINDINDVKDGPAEANDFSFCYGDLDGFYSAIEGQNTFSSWNRECDDMCGNSVLSGSETRQSSRSQQPEDAAEV